MRRTTAITPKSAFFPSGLQIMFAWFGRPGAHSRIELADLHACRHFAVEANDPIVTVAAHVDEPSSAGHIILLSVEHFFRYVFGVGAGNDAECKDTIADIISMIVNNDQRFGLGIERVRIAAKVAAACAEAKIANSSIDISAPTAAGYEPLLDSSQLAPGSAAAAARPDPTRPRGPSMARVRDATQSGQAGPVRRATAIGRLAG